MTEDLFIQIGRVVFINFGPSAGKIAVVLDIINDNSILVDGPTSGVERSIVPLKRVEVTKFLVPQVLRNMRTSAVKKHLEAFKLNERWAATEKAKRHARQEKRAQLSDFDRFKVVTLKRKLGATLRKWVNEKRKTLVKTDAKKK